MCQTKTQIPKYIKANIKYFTLSGELVIESILSNMFQRFQNTKKNKTK